MALRSLLKATSDFHPITTKLVKSQLHQDHQVEDDLEIRFDDINTKAVKKGHKAFLDQLAPPAKRSWNLAAYVNESKTLRELIKLQVSLYDIENSNYEAARRLLTLDYHRDCVPRIKFLVDCGIKPSNLGRFISEYPNIFQTPIDDLQVRLDYLESKGFDKSMLTRILNKSSIVLSTPTKTTDFKLGQLQVEFGLPARIIRSMLVRHPEVIGLPHGQYRVIKFCLSEEYGFTTNEIHSILGKQPQVLDILRPDLIDRIDLIHNRIGLSHQTIVTFAKIITGPLFDIKYRFLYLEKLKRSQFDPEKPLYVPPSALYGISDEKFCTHYAKTDASDYKLFIKSC